MIEDDVQDKGEGVIEDDVQDKGDGVEEVDKDDSTFEEETVVPPGAFHP